MCGGAGDVGFGDGVGLGGGVGFGFGVVREGPKVEPMSPTRISENFTFAFGNCLSTSAGTPEVIGQGPRNAPGLSG